MAWPPNSLWTGSGATLFDKQHFEIIGKMIDLFKNSTNERYIEAVCKTLVADFWGQKFYVHEETQKQVDWRFFSCPSAILILQTNTPYRYQRKIPVLYVYVSLYPVIPITVIKKNGNVCLILCKPFVASYTILARDLFLKGIFFL